MNEMVFPLPVKRYRDKASGELRDVRELPMTGYIAKVLEELSEAAAEANKALIAQAGGDDDARFFAAAKMAGELVDTITACITFLEGCGYGEASRQSLYRDVNEKNKARGYLD